MQPEFPEYVTNPEVIRELIKDRMVDGHYPLFGFPFLCIGNVTDLSKMLYLNNKGTIGARARTEFSLKDIIDLGKFFEKNAKDVYNVMSWDLKDGICNKFFNEIKEAAKISKNSDKLHEVSSKFIKWSEKRSNRRKSIKDLCDAVKQDSGYRVDVIFVNDINFYEFWDEAETSDIDEDRTYNTRSICKTVAYLKDPRIWLIGVEGDFIPEGDLLGVCFWRGEPVVEILYGVDPDFGNGNNGTEFSQLLKDNIPLCVNIFKGGSEDEEKENEAVKDRIIIEAWLDFVVHVKYPNGVFYLEDVI